MIATLHRKNSAGAGKFSFFHILHPRSIHTNRKIVFLFARDRARMAADALAVINDEAIVHGKIIITCKRVSTSIRKKAAHRRTGSGFDHLDRQLLLISC